MKRLLIPSVIFISLALAGCQQDVSDIISQAQQCRIKTGNYYGGSGGLNDSASFIYDATGKLVKIGNQDGEYLFSYSGDKIIRRSFFDQMFNDVIYLDSVYYNSNHSIAEFVSYDYTGMWGADTIQSRIKFHYENNMLAGLTNLLIENYAGMIYSDSIKMKVYWTGTGNIDRIVYLDPAGQAVDSIRYQYDGNPNYFKVVHPHFFLLDPMFELYAGLEPHFAYFYSTNNVINSNMYGSFDYPITYGLDSLNKVTSVDMSGFDYMKYNYECQ